MNKGYGNSVTIPFDVYTEEIAKLVLLSLSETVAARLRADKVRAEVLAVGIKRSDFSYSSHQITLKTPTNITSEVYKLACKAFVEHWDGAAIRHLGIHTSRIKDGINMRQINMFDSMDYFKLEMLDSTVDNIRKRYGRDSIKRSSLAFGAINHMSGGVQEEKRKVDYSKIEVI